MLQYEPSGVCVYVRACASGTLIVRVSAQQTYKRPPCTQGYPHVHALVRVEAPGILIGHNKAERERYGMEDKTYHDASRF